MIHSEAPAKLHLDSAAKWQVTEESPLDSVLLCKGKEHRGVRRSQGPPSSPRNAREGKGQLLFGELSAHFVEGEAPEQ